jgi:putative zinc finger protein
MPSQDNENAMDGLLRRSLARDSAAAGDCPDAELLAAYFDQALGADEAAGYELHFSTCPRCREQLAAMARASTGQMVQPDLALEPALAGARPVPAIALDAARTPAQAKPAVFIAHSETKFPERKSPDARWLDLRWLIPVAAMLVLGTVVFMRFASHETTVGLNNQVAVSKPAAPPQDQTALGPEKKATDAATVEKAAPNNQPSATSAPSRSRASIASATGAAANPQRNERVSARSGTASRNAPAATSRPSQTAGGRTSSFQPNKQVAGAISSATVQEYQKAASEPAPAAPAPELNASMAKIPVAAASADAVKSPAPPPHSGAATKTQGFGLGGRNLNGLSATKHAAKAKQAEEGYTETIISTPDSDVFYRIAGGGFVEISEDGGATWQRQLLNPSAEFTAGSAPEPRICWLVGRSGIVFLTEDGKSWRELLSPTSEDLVVVVAKSASNATVTTTDDRKWSTDDDGRNWRPVK